MRVSFPSTPNSSCAVEMSASSRSARALPRQRLGRRQHRAEAHLPHGAPISSLSASPTARPSSAATASDSSTVAGSTINRRSVQTGARGGVEVGTEGRFGKGVDAE